MGAHHRITHMLARWCYRCQHSLMVATNRGEARLWVCVTCRESVERGSNIVEAMEQESGLVLHDLVEAA